MERKNITIYCDGSCYWKAKTGGIGVYIQWENEEYFIQKGYKDTTISRCELRAFLTALQALKKDIPISATIYSDSQYVVSGLTENIHKWIELNWEGVSNEDLWKEILKEMDEHMKLRIRLRWIEGHQKNIEDPHVFGNNVADLLANYKQFKEYEHDTKFITSVGKI